MTKSLNSYDAGRAWVLGLALSMLIAGFLPALSRFLSFLPEILVAILIMRRRSVSITESLRLRPVGPSSLVFPACFAISLSSLETLLLEGLDLLSGGRLGDAAGLVSPDLPEDFLATLAFAVLLVPIAEEVLFRGFFLTSMGEIGPGWAILAPSLLFAVGHSPFSWAGAFTMAIAGSVLALETGSILPAIVLHAAGNLLGVTLPLIHDSMPGSPGDIALLLALLAGVSLAFLFIPQYRNLWRSVRGYWADFRDQPFKGNLKYLLKHWSYKVILVIAVGTVFLCVYIISTGQPIALD